MTAGPAAAASHPVGDGAWSWFGDPRAVTHDGRTYVGWVDQEGDIKVSSYDHATGERVTAVLHSRLQQDDHANPSIQVRPDGRLVVYYSAHVGPAMHYRVSAQPEDVTAWDPPQAVDENTPGNFGYTYPNPIRLEDEGRTYLFWRGGNYNPTFSFQDDGETTWSSPARTLITNPGSRPYVKYDASGGDTIHVAYTNLHPGEQANIARDSNIYYARVQGGDIERVGGQQIGSLDDPITPAEGDLVWDQAAPAWIHDVAADASGNPVLVFASFPTVTDHRYHYARWTGSAWQVNEITAAGGSFAEESGRSPRYSGGITLDHEDPTRVYLSRQIGAGAWQVETRTTANGGASWSAPTVVSGGGKNVRPVSPRGMAATGGDQSVLWMNGPYFNYEEYGTAINAFTPLAANVAPIADAEPNVRSGPASLEVTFGDRWIARSGRLDRELCVGLRRRRHDRQHRAGAHAHLHGGRPVLPDAHRDRRRRRVEHVRRRDPGRASRPAHRPHGRGDGLDRPRSGGPAEPVHELAGRLRGDRGVRQRRAPPRRCPATALSTR